MAGTPLFLPFLYGSAHGAVGASFAGMRAGHGRAHLLRAVLDGVVFSHRTHLDALRSQFPLAGPARLCGGGARSTQWSQLLADATCLDLEITDSDEAGARGAAVLAGLGIGWFASIDEAVDATVRVARRHEATPSAELDGRYHAYLDLVDTIARGDD